MPYLLDLVYLVALLLASPWLLYKSLTTGKYRRGLWRKLTGNTNLVMPDNSLQPRAWFHGVSVGEIHLLRQVVASFRQQYPHWQCVISTTTDTGYEEARRNFPDLSVVYWPFDFSWAVRRAIREVRPNLVVLAEGELWPNFLLAAQRHQVPVAVINGRLSPRSAKRYRLVSALARTWLKNVDCFAVQTEEYAASFRSLGVPAERIHVTGSVKYDGVQTNRKNPRTLELGRLLQVADEDLIWIAGSTQAPEEEITLEIYRHLKRAHSRLRLFVVPRQRERFDEVASLGQKAGLPLVRRSLLQGPVQDRDAVVLMDTIGELGALWGLADIAYVGGSLDGRRGGQNMIEPAAYGAAVVFGPHVWNFRATADSLVKAGAAIQVADADALRTAIERLLDDPPLRTRLGETARQLVLQQQGATERTLAALSPWLRPAFQIPNRQRAKETSVRLNAVP